MASIATRDGAFIDGGWVAGEGEQIEVISPGTGETLGSLRAASPAQVDAAVAAAAAAFPAWRATPLVERVELCRRAHALCLERNEEIAQMISREVGKTIREAREEMEEYTVDHFRRASEDVLRYAGQVLPSTQERSGTKRILVVQEPVGVVAAISPWNFPVDIAGIPIVFGLAAGCTVVWKPSEYAPLCAGMFVELLTDAGFPPGTINLVHGRGDAGSQLVRHPDVASVVFTGSVETGERVAHDAGLKNRVLELGGNGPQIVPPSPAASTWPVSAAPRPSGSSCTRRSRTSSWRRLSSAPGRSGSATRSTTRPTWARSARRPCSSEPSSTSPTPSPAAPPWCWAAGRTASSTSRP